MDVRGEFAGLGVDGGRVAGVAAAPVGAEHGQTGIEGAAQIAGVAQPGAQHVRARETLGGLRRGLVGAAQRAERGVRAGRQQPVLQAQAAARRAVPRGPVRPVQPAGPAEERPVPRGQPLRPGRRLQHMHEQLIEECPGPRGGQPRPGGPGQHQLHLVQQGVLVRSGQVEPAALPAQPVPYDDLAQCRDPPGGERGQPAPSEVREVAVGEGEFVLEEEGAPVDGAPRRELHTRQLGEPLRREGALRCPRQQRGGRVRRLALPPGRPLVLGVEHVDPCGLGQARVQRRQRARHEQVVAVEEQHVRAGRHPQPGVARPAQTGGRW